MKQNNCATCLTCCDGNAFRLDPRWVRSTSNEQFAKAGFRYEGVRYAPARICGGSVLHALSRPVCPPSEMREKNDRGLLFYSGK